MICLIWIKKWKTKKINREMPSKKCTLWSPKKKKNKNLILPNLIPTMLSQKKKKNMNKNKNKMLKLKLNLIKKKKKSKNKNLNNILMKLKILLPEVLIKKNPKLLNSNLLNLICKTEEKKKKNSVFNRNPVISNNPLEVQVLFYKSFNNNNDNDK